MMLAGGLKQTSIVFDAGWGNFCCNQCKDWEFVSRLVVGYPPRSGGYCRVLDQPYWNICCANFCGKANKYANYTTLPSQKILQLPFETMHFFWSLGPKKAYPSNLQPWKRCVFWEVATPRDHPKFEAPFLWRTGNPYPQRLPHPFPRIPNTSKVLESTEPNKLACGLPRTSPGTWNIKGLKLAHKKWVMNIS